MAPPIAQDLDMAKALYPGHMTIVQARPECEVWVCYTCKLFAWVDWGKAGDQDGQPKESRWNGEHASQGIARRTCPALAVLASDAAQTAYRLGDLNAAALVLGVTAYNP